MTPFLAVGSPRLQVHRHFVPLLAWGAVSIISAAVTYAQLRQGQQPMRDMHTASSVSAAASNVRRAALEVATLCTVGPPGAAAIAAAQAALATAAGTLLDAHVTLLRSETSGLLAGTGPLATAHGALMFQPSCLRSNQSGCYPPRHPYNPVTRFGLDPLLRHYVRQAQLLAQDPPANISFANARFAFLWEVGQARAVRINPGSRV